MSGLRHLGKGRDKLIFRVKEILHLLNQQVF
jgi:hypothetical protein